MQDEPLVSVLVVTYNHQKYIRQALDSVAAQETEFAVEIVVADDCSQDATLALVREYQAHQENMRILPAACNVGITRNYQRGFGACRGQYVAVLEGDDFWISPTKLKTLAAFLAEHQDCAFCFHPFLKYDEASGQLSVPAPLLPAAAGALFTAAQLARENFIGNFSACMYRRAAIDRLAPELFELKVYDWMFNITVAQEGRIGYIPQFMSVYRAHSRSAWSSLKAEEQRGEVLAQIDAYNQHLRFKFDQEFQALKEALLTEVDLQSISPPRARGQ